MVNVQSGTFETYVKNQNAIIEKLTKKINDLETQNNELVTENLSLASRIKTLEERETSNVTKPKLFSDFFKSKKPDEDEANILNAIRVERNEEFRKEKNVVVFGTKYNTNIDEDKKLIEEISSAIGFEKTKIKYIRRFKRPNDQTESTPILVELTSRDDKINILRCARTLKDIENYKKVFIAPDQTFAERELNKSLISKRNQLNENNDSNTSGYRFGIRNYEIVKIRVLSQNSAL